VIFIRTGMFFIQVINTVYNIFWFLLLARIIFSFIRLGRDADPTLVKIVRLVYSLTEPVLLPLRRMIRPLHLGSGAYLDLSPLIAILLLGLARSLLVRLIISALL